MLKLQSKGGKFDIVLSDASLQGVGNSSKKSVKSLSSAGRRKTKELKSHNILPTQKEVSPRQAVKTKTRQSQETVKIEDDSPRNQAANQPTAKPAKTLANQKNAKNTKQPNSHASKQRTQAKSNITASQAKTRKNVSSNDASENIDYRNTGVISQAQLASIMDALKNGDASVLASLTVKNPPERDVSVEAPSSNRAKNDTYTSQLVSDRVEPTSVPGLDLEASTREKRGKFMQNSDVPSIDTASFTSKNELQGISYSTTPAQSKQSSNTTPISLRAERVAMRSSFAIGAPGQVTYDYNQAKRDKNKQYLADLEKQMQSKRTIPLSDKERFIQAMEDTTSQPATTRQVKNSPSVPTSYGESAGPLVSNGTLQAAEVCFPEKVDRSPVVEEHREQTHALGGRHVRSQFELDEIEQKRIKHLEHQRAVQAQVEEKRRLKMEERDRKYQEEKIEEARLAKERDFLAAQYEEEKKKQLEKEEAEKQRQLALQNSILEAYETAKKEKQNAVLLKLKAGGHDISHLQHGEVDVSSDAVNHDLERLQVAQDSVEMSQQYSSRSDKGFRPILNLTDETYEEKKKQTNSKQTRKDSKTKNVKSARNEEAAGTEKARKLSDARKKHGEQTNVEVRKHRASIDSKKSSKKTETVQERRNKKVLKPNSKEQKSKSAREEKPVREKQRKQTKEHSKGSSKKPKQAEKLNPEILTVHNEAMENLMIDDDDFSYNRSSTVTLQDEESADSRRDTSVSGQRLSHQENKEDFTSWDSWGAPTNRQQQILDQLQTLRKGLMDKKKEYERGTTPSSSLFR